MSRDVHNQQLRWDLDSCQADVEHINGRIEALIERLRETHGCSQATRKAGAAQRAISRSLFYLIDASELVPLEDE